MKESILIVDDEETLRLTLRGRLRTAGFSVDTAGDGEEALEKLQERSFDIVLLDINMPKMNGIKVLEHISEAYPNTSTIMLTGFADFTVAVESLKKGASDFLVKPIETSELLARLKTITKIRAAEQALREAHQEYATHLTNDVLTPLEAITTALRNLAHHAVVKGAEDVQRLVMYAQRVSDSIVTRVKDRLILSHYEEGMLRLERKPSDLGALIQQAVDRLQATAATRKVTVKITPLPEFPPINCDAAKVELALGNVLDHLLSRADEGSSITVTLTKSLANNHHEQPQIAHCSIASSSYRREESDWVPSVNREERPEVESMRRLGFSVARRIIEAHDGTMWMETEEGKGASVHISLPV